MPRDYKVFLQDAIDAIDNIAEFVGNMPLDAFKDDKKTLHAVVRNLEVIGEPGVLGARSVLAKLATASSEQPVAHDGKGLTPRREGREVEWNSVGVHWVEWGR